MIKDINTIAAAHVHLPCVDIEASDQILGAYVGEREIVYQFQDGSIIVAWDNLRSYQSEIKIVGGAVQ